MQLFFSDVFQKEEKNFLIVLTIIANILEDILNRKILIAACASNNLHRMLYRQSAINAKTLIIFVSDGCCQILNFLL